MLGCEPQGYVEQAALILSTGRGNPRLKDLYMRPIISGSRRIQVRVGWGVQGQGVLKIMGGGERGEYYNTTIVVCYTS